MNAKPTETKTTEIPKLNDWVPEPEDQIFVLQPGANVISARFEMTGDCDNDEFKSRMMLLDTFAIKQNHYMTRMQDITHVINYFIKFFIVCFRHKCCCVFIRNKFNKITEGFFVFSLTYNIEYYTE